MQEKTLKQIIQFGLVGGVNTLLTYAIYFLTYQQIGAVAAMALGYGITSIIGLLVNRTWVFSTKKDLNKIIPRFYTTYGITWLLSIIATAFFNDVIHIAGLIVPIFSLLITFPINYILSRKWVFATKKEVA